MKRRVILVSLALLPAAVGWALVWLLRKQVDALSREVDELMGDVAGPYGDDDDD